MDEGAGGPEAEDPQAQQIDLDDADVSAEPLAAEASLPPGAPPPLPAMPPLPPAPSSRSALFYVGVLVGVLVLSAAVGTVIALTRRRAPPTAATPKVITIGTIEMDDNPDSGP